MSQRKKRPEPDPEPPHVRQKRLRGRRVRLFACACCRRFWELFDEPARRLVELTERFLDGTATWPDVEAARDALGARFIADAPANILRNTAAYVALPAADAARHAVEQATLALDEAAARAWHEVLTHDLHGQGETTFAVEWQQSGPVTTLARAIYQDRVLPLGTLDAESFLVLADALEDAGCTTPAILDHCRAPGATHVRGCWVLEGLLGRELG